VQQLLFGHRPSRRSSHCCCRPALGGPIPTEAAEGMAATVAAAEIGPVAPRARLVAVAVAETGPVLPHAHSAAVAAALHQYGHPTEIEVSEAQMEIDLRT
jgi:hypothetical protein